MCVYIYIHIHTCIYAYNYVTIFPPLLSHAHRSWQHRCPATPTWSRWLKLQ